jgi:regulator of PEP synthase PpsR (kinase-PPPase family)
MVEIGFIFYFSTLFVIYVVMTIRDSLINKNMSAKIRDLRISKKKMVENVLQWCETNHSIPKKRGKLSYKINYYNHTKLEGCYCGYNKNITVYITPEKRIIDVVDTLLHEYQHHIDMRTQKEVKLYFKQLNHFGYDNHPMEISAREFARQHRDECFETFKKNWL